MVSIAVYLMILSILLVFSFSIYILLDKNRSNSWLAKKFLSIFTVLVLVLLIVVYEYTYSDLKQKIENVKVSSISIESDDSLLMTNNGRKQLEDSLLLLKSQLSKLQNQLKKKSVLLGSNNQFHRDIQEDINITDANIDKVKSYNEILPPSFYDKKYKGTTYSHETSSIILYPPKNLNSDFLDFSFIFTNENIITDVAAVYVAVYIQHPDGNRRCLFEEYYKPQKNINKFRVKNILRQKNVEMSVGYFWKNEFGKKDFLNYEHVTFRI